MCISVIIPVYNGVDNGLSRCLKAVIAQDLDGLEIIIVNDHSTDDSKNVAEELLKEHSKFKIINNTQNQGLSKSWNIGIMQASRDIVLLLHQDCILYDKKQLLRAYEFLRENKDVGGIVGKQVYEFSQMNFYQKFMEYRLGHYLSSSTTEEIVSITENKCDLIRKELFSSVGKFSQKLKLSGEDLLISSSFKRSNTKLIRGDRLLFQDALIDKSTLAATIDREWLYGKTMPDVFMNDDILFTKENAKRDPLVKHKRNTRLLTPLYPISLIILGLALLIGFFNFEIFITITTLILARIFMEVKRLRNVTSIEPQVELSIGLSVCLSALLDMVYVVGIFFGILRHFILRRI